MDFICSVDSFSPSQYFSIKNGTKQLKQNQIEKKTNTGKLREKKREREKERRALQKCIKRALSKSIYGFSSVRDTQFYLHLCTAQNTSYKTCNSNSKFR